MARRTLASCALLLLLLATSNPAQGRDLRKRFAVGFNNQFGPLTSLSVKFTLPAPEPTINIQIQLMTGFALLARQNNTFFVGARTLFTLIAEDNLNVYGGIGAGWVRFDARESAVRIQPILGVEFFFFGLENLGFSIEGGLSVDAGTSGVDVQTTAGMFSAAGVHYYF